MSLEPSKVDYSSFYYCRYKRNAPVKPNYHNYNFFSKYSDYEKANAIKFKIQNLEDNDYSAFNNKYNDDEDLIKNKNINNQNLSKETDFKNYNDNNSFTCGIFNKPIDNKEKKGIKNVKYFNDKYTEDELNFLYKQAQLDELKEKIKSLDKNNNTEKQKDYIPPYNYKNKYYKDLNNDNEDINLNQSNIKIDKDNNIKDNLKYNNENIIKENNQQNELNLDENTHSILDVREIKSNKNNNFNDRKNNPVNYEKRSYKYDEKSKRKAKIFISVVLICFIILFILAETLLTDDVINANPAWLTSGNIAVTYYGVSMESFIDRESAVTYANELRKLGGGGFILKNSSFNIIAAIYPTESDARDVMSKINKSGNSSVLYNFNIPKHKLKNYTKDEMDVINETLKYYTIVYDDLYKLSNDVDTEVINDVDMKAVIQKLIDKLVAIKTTFETTLDVQKMDLNIVKIKAEIVATIGIVDNLLNDNLTRPNILCDIRYSYIMVINNYINMIKSLEE